MGGIIHNQRPGYREKLDLLFVSRQLQNNLRAEDTKICPLLRPYPFLITFEISSTIPSQAWKLDLSVCPDTNPPHWVSEKPWAFSWRADHLQKMCFEFDCSCMDFFWTMISEDSRIYQDVLEDEAQKTMFRGPLEWTNTGNDTRQ